MNITYSRGYLGKYLYHFPSPERLASCYCFLQCASVNESTLLLHLSATRWRLCFVQLISADCSVCIVVSCNCPPIVFSFHFCNPAGRALKIH